MLRLDRWAEGQVRRPALAAVHSRRPNSKWSKINRDKALALIELGRMRPPGLAEVERAKTDGRWQAAYDGARTSSVPDDLVAALAANPAAAQFFETLDRQNRFAILYRIQDVKKPETRARRIEKYVAMLAEERSSTPERWGRLRAGRGHADDRSSGGHQFGGETPQGLRPRSDSLRVEGDHDCAWPVAAINRLATR